MLNRHSGGQTSTRRHILRSTIISPSCGTILIAFLLSSAFFACQREIVDMPPAVPENSDCRLKRLEQGQDTILTLYYDSRHQISKVVDYDKPSDFADSVLATYDGQGKLIALLWDSPFPLNIDFTYRGDTLVQYRILDDDFSSPDTTVYDFIYSAGKKKPDRINMSIFNFAHHGLSRYYLLEYDANDDISMEKIFDNNGTLYQQSSYTYTDLPNSFSEIGATAGLFNIYDAESSMFWLAWMNQHNLASKTVTYDNGDVSINYLEYQQDSTGRVVSMQSVRDPGSPNSVTFHYKLFYECP